LSREYSHLHAFFKDKRKLHLANWNLACMPKAQGELGIPCLRDVNIYLLASWLKRYSDTKDRLWNNIFDSKYNTPSPNISIVREASASRVFKGSMWAARSVHFGYRWIVGDGEKIRLWEDTWFGTSPL
jgi:hypothetical protein